MKFFSLLNQFKNDESGAVTVDWVVLTAAIVGLGLAVMVAVRPAAVGLGSRIGSTIDTIMPY